MTQVLNSFIEEILHDTPDSFWERVEEVKQENLKYRLVVHIHSKLEMCPFCLRTLFKRVKQWNASMQELLQVPVVAIVSSREEYSPTLMCLATYSTVPAQSMRSLGLDIKSHSLIDEDDLIAVEEVNKEKVVQFPFSFYQSYR